MGLESTTRMLAPFLDRLTDEELDAIPYGVVQLDAQGFVLSYNRAEMANALWNAQRPIGQDFFADIAPSARVPEIFGRFVDAFASQSCDDVFRFTYTCGDLPRTVRLRMYFRCALTRSGYLRQRPTAHRSGTVRNTSTHCRLIDGVS